MMNVTLIGRDDVKDVNDVTPLPLSMTDELAACSCSPAHMSQLDMTLADDLTDLAAGFTV